MKVGTFATLHSRYHRSFEVGRSQTPGDACTGPQTQLRTASFSILVALVILFAGASSVSLADNLVWDGSTDTSWTNGPQDPNGGPFPQNGTQGANWTNTSIDPNTAGLILGPTTLSDPNNGITLPSGNRIDYTFTDHNFTISSATINEDVQIKLSGGSLNITGSTVSLVPTSATTTAGLSGLNLGQNGSATTGTITNSTLTTSRANQDGNSLRIQNGSSFDVVNSNINVSSELGSGNFTVEQANSTLTIDATSTVSVTGGLEVTNSLANVELNGGVLDTGWVRLDSGPNTPQSLMFDFFGGTVTLNDSNPLRDNSGFEGAFDWVGTAGSGTVVHTDLSSNNQNLAGKIAQGYFSIDGVQIDPAIGNTVDWTNSTNRNNLNSQLAELVVGGKVLNVTFDDPNSRQVLSLVSVPVISWDVDSDGLFGVANNWDPNTVPTNTDTALLGAGAITAPRTVTLDAAYNLGGLTFSGTQTYTVAGTAVNTLTTPDITVSGTHVVAAPLVGTGGLTVSGGGTLQLTANNSGLSGGFTVDGGNLEVTDPNQLGGNAVTLNPGGELHISGDGLGGSGFAGTFNETVTGDGELNFTNSLTTEVITLGSGLSGHNGALAIDGGVVIANDASDFGGSGATWINQAAGQLQISTGLTTGENFNLGSRADGSDAHLAVTAGNPTFTGNVNGTGGDNQHIIEVASGSTLTINGTVGSPAVVSDENDTGTFVFQGDGNVVIGNAGTPGSGFLGNNDPNTFAADTNVIKRGSGNLTIATATTNSSDYWGGTTTVEGGTLTVLSDGASGGELISSSINLADASTVFEVSDFGAYTIQTDQTITGVGTVNAGSNTLQIAESSIVSPGIRVGTLNVTGNLTLRYFDSGETQAPNTGKLLFELGDNPAVIGGTENDLLAATGNLTITADTPASDQFRLEVVPVEGALAAGTYSVITYAGSLLGNGSASNFDPVITDSDGNVLDTRQSVSITTDSDSLNVVVSGSASNLFYVSGNWDVNSSVAWATIDGGGATQQFFDLDTANFTDNSSNKDVNITENVFFGGMIINNSAGNDYTFTGTGALTGSGTIVKQGTGTATLANSPDPNGGTEGLNTFSGGISVQGGTLVLDSPNNETSGDISISGGATLQVGDGNGVGVFTNDPNVAVTVNGTLRGSVGAGAEGIFQNLTGSGTVEAVSGGLNLLADNSGFTGNFLASGGELDARSLTAFGDPNAATPAVTANAGGTIEFTVPDDGSGVINFNKNYVVAGAGEGGAFDGAIKHSTDNVTYNQNGTVSLTGDTTIRTDGQGLQVNYNGAISGTNTSLTVNMGNGGGAGTTINGGSITNINSGFSLGTGGLSVVGTGSADAGTNPGILNLNTANTYSGDTSIGEGGTGPATVVLNAAGALGSTSNIRLGENGNLDVTNVGGLTLTSGQTVAGQGTVTGNLSAPTGTTIQVGEAGVPNVSALLSRHNFEVAGEDSSGNGNDVTLGASASVDTVTLTPVGSGSLALTDATDNDGNRAEGDGYAGVTGTGARTYSFWFNSSDPNQENNATFIGAGANNTSERFDIKINAAGELRVEIQGTGINFTDQTTTDFFDGNWHHLAVTLPENSSLDNVALYLDGVAQTDNNGNNGNIVNTGNTNIYYGDSHNEGESRNFQGNMDDVQIYRTALSASEVLALFNSPGTVDGSTLPDTSGIGMLTMDGDLTMQAGSTLEIDLFSTSLFDSLSVTGALAAGGTLDVDYFGLSALDSGDSFDILDFDPNSLTGSFALDLPALASGLIWDTSNLLSTGVISVVLDTIAGDFNGDGRVDGRDFLEWQRNPAIGNLADWEANYGLPTTSNTTTIPEPSSALLLLFGASMGLVRRKRCA